MVTPYRDFTELILNTVRDRDYRFVIADRSTPVTMAAIHGGGIEPLTSELAAAIAGGEHNLYDFRGIRPQDNELLRISVQRFDELRLRELMKRSQVGLGIEGVEGQDLAVHLGGRNRRLRALLAERLQQAGFEVAGPAGPGAAHDPTRYYNWASDGGVQIELPRALRASLLNGPLSGFLWENPAQWNERFYALVAAVRSALDHYLAQMRSDLDAALQRFEEGTRVLKELFQDNAEDRRDN
jgi:phage replication-related protein YjqB (UPF0714/DUF867 family)